MENWNYYRIVRDILENEEFQKTKDIVHHGHTRYEHCLRVSLVSYYVSKVLHLNVKEVTRAALLHDFFLEDNLEITKKKRAKLLVNHPKKALENASKYFELSDIEKDIILTHMFPVAPRVPRYIESWIVDLIDDLVAVYEKAYVVRNELSTAMCFILFVLFNYGR